MKSQLPDEIQLFWDYYKECIASNPENTSNSCSSTTINTLQLEQVEEKIAVLREKSKGDIASNEDHTIQIEHLELVKPLLQQTELDTLTTSVGRGYNEIVRVLLPFCNPTLLQHILSIAAKQGHGIMLKCILQHSETHSSNYASDRDCALYLACLNQHIGLALELVEQGANVNYSEQDYTTPFAIACTSNVELVAAMLKKGADPNVSIYGSSPLVLASAFGKVDIAKLLIENGAQVNETSSDVVKEACRALYSACENNHADLVDVLLENGAYVTDEKNINSIQPIHIACGTSTGSRMVVNLIKHGARMDVAVKSYVYRAYGKFIFYETPLNIVAKHRNVELLRALVSLWGGWLLPARRKTPPIIHAPSQPAIKTITVEQENHPFSGAVKIFDLSLSSSAPGSTLYEEISEKLVCPMVPGVFEVKWKGLIVEPGKRTLQEMGFGAQEHVFVKFGSEEITVWELCADDEEVLAALHNEWTPKSHLLFPKPIQDAILSIMIIARREWEFDTSILHKLFKYISFGWLEKG